MYSVTRSEGNANCNHEEDPEDTADHGEDQDAPALEDKENQCQASEGEQQPGAMCAVTNSKQIKASLQSSKHHAA